MAERFQYPILASIDPTTLDAPLRDELQWYLDFSFPVWPAHQTRPGWFTIDPTTLDAPLRDELQWFVPLSEPVLPRHLFQRAEAAVIDPETLSEGLRDEIQWFVEFSVPVLQISSVAEIPVFFIDPEAFGEAEALADVTLDEHQPLSEPVRPEIRQQPEAFVIDPATLDAVLRDELQWFLEFSVPVLPEHQVRPGIAVADPETLGDPFDDKLEWFQPFGDPIRDVARVIEAGNIFVDEPVVAAEDELDWFQGFSLPMRQLAAASYAATQSASGMSPADMGAARVFGRVLAVTPISYSKGYKRLEI